MKEIIMISTADWSNPFWTNKQHTAQTLAKLGYRVFYIDSLGSRKLYLTNGNDLKRVWRRIKQLFAKPQKVADNIYVWSPCVLPPSSKKWAIWINRLYFSIVLGFWRKRYGFDSQSWLWTYNPLTLLYVNSCQYAKVIYHCVDNIAEQPGALAELIDEEEQALFKQADKVFVTARELEKRAKRYSSQVYYHPNVVEYDHFSRAQSNIVVPEDMQAIPAPRAMFIGAISAYKMNIDLLLDVTRQLPDISFVFIGAVGEGDPDTNIEALAAQSNVYLPGPKPYEQLPNYLKGADVCLIPANVNEYTKSMFPMKFFEYLAAGKPVVATDIPSIMEFAEHYYVADNAGAFAKQLLYALENHHADKVEQGQQLASRYTYFARTEKMLACI